MILRLFTIELITGTCLGKRKEKANVRDADGIGMGRGDSQGDNDDWKGGGNGEGAERKGPLRDDNRPKEGDSGYDCDGKWLICHAGICNRTLRLW